MGTEFVNLPIECLQAGPYQPRQDFNSKDLQELALSIENNGLIEPLIVRIIAGQQYEIVAGERRWRAAKLAKLTEIPCLLGNYSDKQACTLALIENIQRQDLNLIEEADGYMRLVQEFHYRQDEIAILVSKSRSHIANLLRLRSLTSKVQELIRNKLLTLGHARVLVGLEPHQQEYFANDTIKEHWSVRHLEGVVQDYKKKLTSPQPSPKKDKDIERLQTQLAEQMGAPVQIVSDCKEGGWLKVKFFDNDTLEGLLERLGLRYD